MLKDTTYKEKFKMLDGWLSTILDQIKKDLKQDHLQKDNQFFKTHFSGKNLTKLTVEDLVIPYRELLQNESEEAGEYVTNRWLLKNTEVYYFFEERLKQITPDFNELEELDEKKSQHLIDEAVNQFGAPKTYIFSVLNSVVFPKSIYDQLAQKATQHKEKVEQEAIEKKEKQSHENLIRTHQNEIARLTDKYEKKLSGLQKKYLQDVESLKKQVATLQRKLNG